MSYQLSDEIRQQIDALKGRYPDPEGAVMPALHLVQAEHGWVPREAMDAVARLLGVPSAHVLATATFYTMYNKKPVGRFHLQVCTNVACGLKGGFRMVDLIRERLGIEPGETTPDGRFTLTEVECLAACGSAPVMQVNDDYHENLDEASVKRLLDELEARP